MRSQSIFLENNLTTFSCWEKKNIYQFKLRKQISQILKSHNLNLRKQISQICPHNKKFVVILKPPLLFLLSFEVFNMVLKHFVIRVLLPFLWNVILRSLYKLFSSLHLIPRLLLHIFDILFLIYLMDWKVSLKHIYREANSCVDFLANLGHRGSFSWRTSSIFLSFFSS